MTIGFLTAIAFTALALGTVEPWSVAIFEILVALLLFLWILKALLEKHFELNVPVTFWPVAAFFIFGVIQSIAVTDAAGKLSSLSVDVEATRYTVTILFFLLAAHLIAANYFNTDSRMQTLSKFLTIFGFLLAVFGLIQFFAWNGSLFWFRPSDGGRWVQGPFVNHNHFAGYLELIVPIPLALIATGAVKESRVVYGFAAVVMIIATIFSASRGGIISLSIAFIFIAVSGYNYKLFKHSSSRHNHNTDALPSAAKNTRFRQTASTMIIIGSILAGLLWLGLGPILDRLPDNRQTESYETFEGSRGWIWKNAVAVFKDNPIFGTGMGTFETALPKYSEGNMAGPDGKLLVWDRSHNDYLQILSDTGLIGGVLAIWFIIAVISLIRRGFYLKDRFRAGLALGCFGAILSLLLHSIFDFNLQLPATSLLFLTLTAVAANLMSKPDKAKSELVKLSESTELTA